ncbi:MAG: hypothetical protein ACFFBD_20875 [Candidatus Hodarchaeota archaeon]
MSCGIQKVKTEVDKSWLICGVCQAYYCPKCAQYWKNQQFMPSCPSMRRKGHRPKFLKFYEYHRINPPRTNTVRILPPKPRSKKKLSVRVYPPAKIKRSAATNLEESEKEKSD